MTVVSSKEFVTNQKRYFDLAIDNELFIKRGKNVFHLICTTVSDNLNKSSKKDFYQAVKACNGTSVDAFFDELDGRLKKHYINA